jgi:hypothetical protein
MRCLGAGVLGCLGAVVLVCLSAAGAHAQDAPSLRAHRVVVSGGATLAGGYAIGDLSAQLRGNTPGATPSPFTLFTAKSDVERVGSAEIRVGFTLTPSVAVEAGASFGAPHIGVSISGDAEAPAQRIKGERLQQYLFDGALVWQLPFAAGRRIRPFVMGGGGHLRQLHEERTMIEIGQVYYAGVGARYWLRGGRGRTRSLGLRSELRANVRRGGIDFENKVRLFPTVALHLFFNL